MGTKSRAANRTSQKPIVAIIGLGSLGLALAKAIAARNKYEIRGFDRNQPKRQEFSKLPGATAVRSIKTAVQGAKIVLICVKPANIDTACKEIGEAVTKAGTDPIIVSTAAAVPVKHIEKCLGADAHTVVRAMPNLLIEVGAGTVGIYGESTKAVEVVSKFFSRFATVQRVAKEERMHAVTAIVGSGPALIVELIRAFKDAMVQAGTPHAEALAFALAIFEGTAKWARKRNDVHLAALIDLITSPGGTTAELMLRVREKGVHAGIQTAIQAATERSQRMAQTYAA